MNDDTEQTNRPVRPGDVLGGKFRIERVLGEGGMGIVCAATHLQLGQLVALKFMLPQAMAHPENVARFEREARNAVRLTSDHVAKVTDVGRLDDGAPYMVMEYLDGKDLDAVLEERGPLPIPVAVDFLLQACEAVAEAHALGIVHRDLKPKNLFLASKHGGRSIVKVLDFGISKQLGATEDMSLTSTAHVMGSPNYMSPEQLRASKDVDHRTDIWALGAILFELLTGQVPFRAETVTQLTAMVVADEPQSIRQLRDDIPDELRAVVLKCLEKKRDERFGSVAELVMALTPFASKEGASAAQSILGSPSALAATSAASIPPERSSLRAAGGSTSVAWDKTQLANTGAPSSPGRSRAPFVLAAVLLAGGLAAAGAFAFRTTGAPSSPTAGSAPAHLATAAGAVEAVTVQEPQTPLVTATATPGHPPPSATVAAVATTTASARVQATHDAGAKAAPTVSTAIPSTTPPPPTTTTSTKKPDDLLPSSRN